MSRVKGEDKVTLHPSAYVDKRPREAVRSYLPTEYFMKYSTLYDQV